MCLKVLIAGGGIGGLAAALACAQAGFAVQVFEKSPAFDDIGAGVQLGPNVTRILNAWGLADALKACAAFPENLWARDAVDGQVLGQLRLGTTVQQRYGSAYATVHRADLHGVLLQALKKFPAVDVQRGTAVDSFNGNHAGDGEIGLTLSGPDLTQQTAAGDLLVGADGLWSKVRNQLLGDGPPQATGHIALRALVAQKDLPYSLQSHDITVWLGRQMHVVHYPVRGGDWLNVVVLLEGELAHGAESWNHAVDANFLLKVMHSTHGPLQNLLHSIEHWQAWPLSQRTPMASAAEHAKGRVALLGDAAHPMLPYMAQGAGMAIEDAAELVRCLAAQSSTANGVSTALQHYARARWQRNARVQSRSQRNAQIFHATGLVRWGRNVSMKLLGERLLDVPWLYQA